MAFKKWAYGLTILAVTAIPNLALAQNVIATDPTSVAAVMESLGFRTTLTTDSDGDPKIESSASGATFAVFFYGCTKGQTCDSISFSAAFDLDDGSSTDLMNSWNQNKRYTTAFLDDEMDPAIDMNVYMGNSGVSVPIFEYYLNKWEVALGDFKDHIDF